ncbi:MAG: DNA repair protein RecN [Saccharofermentanales bacterium]|jgi:DNA repair protein RecN (Recombination protein N)
MIQRVEIDTFALADHLGIDFGPGFTVLSGETGAGKSILIDALDFASGGRADRSMIRSGADEASVSILFKDETAQDESSSNGELLFVRSFRTNGRGYARLNGRLATIGELREASSSRLAIHSQSDQQLIFKENVHLELLDSYGGTSVSEALDAYMLLYASYSRVEQRLKALHLDPETRARRRDILLYQQNEIEQAGIVEDEEETLLKRIKTLTAVRDIVAHVSRALYELESDDDRSASGHLKRAITELESAGRKSARLKELAERAALVQTSLREIIFELDRLQEKLDDRPEALEEANQRLIFLRRLQEKYGQGLDRVLAYANQTREEIEKIDATELELRQLTEERQDLSQALVEADFRLYNARVHAAEHLSRAVNQELSDLNMSDAVFEVSVESIDREDGRFLNKPHRVRFLICPNPGEPMMPLVSIISGGEASRVLLAIKTVLAAVDRVSTIIFDEIDTGISGKTTTMIAEKLTSISRHAQVLCVTHSAQIAAVADAHFLVGKEEKEGRTVMTVRQLNHEERVAEVARLLTGRPEDPSSLALASKMVKGGIPHV